MRARTHTHVDAHTSVEVVKWTGRPEYSMAQLENSANTV